MGNLEEGATKGWQAADKQNVLAMSTAAFHLGFDLANEAGVPIGIVDLDMGYHFASVSYTLFPAANVQTQALQIAQAVNWIHHNSDRLSGDAERIALMGHSAGCHLSSLATLAGAIPSVKAMVCNDSRAYFIFLVRV